MTPGSTFSKNNSHDDSFKERDKVEKRRILVLDDEKDICTLLSSILRKFGHEVICSNSIAAAKSEFTSFRPEVMFMDINLPDGNGLEEATSFLNINHDVQIIMISAFDFPIEMKRSRELNLTFLRKPFNRENVLQSIKAVQ